MQSACLHGNHLAAPPQEWLRLPRRLLASLVLLLLGWPLLRMLP